MDDQGTGSGSGVPSSSGTSPSAPGSQPPSGSPSSGAGPLTPPAPGATPGSQQPQQSPSATGQQPSLARSPIPYERFEEVNTRLNSLNWAEGYEPEEVEQATQLYRWFDSDPEGAYRYLTGLLQQQGYLKDQQAQQQGRVQQARPSDGLTDPQSGRPLPDILVQETGQRLYSADQTQKLLDWAFSQVDSRVKGLEQTQATSQMVAQAQTEARTLISEAEKSWPYFNEFAGDIYRELQKDGRLSLEGAYRRVVFPKVKERSRAEVIAEIRNKAAAGTGSASGPPAPASSAELQKLPLKELFKREWARRSGTG